MKGTLYTADFIKTIDGVKLLELNTDTAFTDSIIDGFDFDPLNTVLTDNNLSKIHLIYKPTIQQNFVDKLTQYLSVSASGVSIETTEENEYTIYPTDVSDAEDTFVLRLAYNESAIFDSEYCKDNVNLYELLKPTDDSGSLLTVNYYYSSSIESVFTDTLLKRTEYATSVPDFVVRQTGPTSDNSDKPGFYKLGHSSASIDDRISDFIQEMNEDGIMITNYHDTSENTDYMKSIRVCNILYGTNLDNITLYAKKVDALFDKPEEGNEFIHDDTQLYTKFHLRHLYELATNHIKFDYNTQDGVGTDIQLLSGSDSVHVELANVGDVYQSIHIPGLPDTDDIDSLYSWSLDGGELPSGSYVTGSTLVSKLQHEVQFGVLREIVIESGSFLAGPNLPLLVYDTAEDKIRYKAIHDVDPSNDKLFNGSGSKVDLLENNFFVLPETGYSYILDFETNDTFLINETSVRIVSHNINYGGGGIPGGFYPLCFVAGTKVTMADGTEKNIEDIQIGEQVISFNEKTRQNEVKSVTDIKSPVHEDIVKYEFENEVTLECTTDHPLYVNNYGLASYNPKKTRALNEIGFYNIKAEINKISTDDVVRDIDKNVIKINSITEKELNQTTTYIISVEDNQNFYANRILVHNKV